MISKFEMKRYRIIFAPCLKFSRMCANANKNIRINGIKAGNNSKL
jgi:hypothetical protein